MPGCEKAKFTKAEAQTALNIFLKKGTFKNKFGRVYECFNCGYWHLTSQPLNPRVVEDPELKHTDKWNDLLNNE